MKTLEEQTDILCQAFPELSFGIDVAEYLTYLDEFHAKTELPAGAEGFFIIPRWDKVDSTYSKALKKVLAVISKDRKFYNYREDQLGGKYFRQSVRTSTMLAKLAKGQPGDFIIIPAQVGMRHRGKSVSQARKNFRDNEFGLDAFSIACILLAHPERLVDYNDLWIDCSGDEYSLAADGQFDIALYFHFYDSRLGLDTYWISTASRHDGSASGFLPPA